MPAQARVQNRAALPFACAGHEATHHWGTRSTNTHTHTPVESVSDQADRHPVLSQQALSYCYHFVTPLQHNNSVGLCNSALTPRATQPASVLSGAVEQHRSSRCPSGWVLPGLGSLAGSPPRLGVHLPMPMPTSQKRCPFGRAEWRQQAAHSQCIGLLCAEPCFHRVMLVHDIRVHVGVPHSLKCSTGERVAPSHF